MFCTGSCRRAPVRGKDFLAPPPPGCAGGGSVPGDCNHPSGASGPWGARLRCGYDGLVDSAPAPEPEQCGSPSTRLQTLSLNRCSSWARSGSVETHSWSPLIEERIRFRARVRSTHYSTAIEGNRLTLEETEQVVGGPASHSPGARDVGEVERYWKALALVQQWAEEGAPLSETLIRKLRTVVDKGAQAKPTPYREAQNLVYDAAYGGLVLGGSNEPLIYKTRNNNTIPAAEIFGPSGTGAVAGGH